MLQVIKFGIGFDQLIFLFQSIDSGPISIKNQSHSNAWKMRNIVKLMQSQVKYTLK